MPTYFQQNVLLLHIRPRVFAFLLLACSGINLGAQSSQVHPVTAELDRIIKLSDGAVSGNMYENAELGFRYQFPKGWIVDDRVAQEKALATQQQFVWDASAKTEPEATRECAKNLLFVTKYPEEMRSNGLNPFAYLIAANPKCTPDVTFPKTVKDHEATQKVVGQLGRYFKTSYVTSRSPVRIRAFDNAGRVMLEASQSLWISTHEPGSRTDRNVHTSILIMQAGEYWVMWMFAGGDDMQLNELRATKIFFDTPSAKPAEGK